MSSRTAQAHHGRRGVIARAALTGFFLMGLTPPTVEMARAADGGGGKPSAAASNSVYPKSPPADRYNALAARSPFSPPTAPAPAPPTPALPAPPGWAEKYTLGSVAQFGPGYRVTLTPKNPASGPNALPTERVTIATGETHSEGISIGSVVWSDQPSQTRITLLKNGVPGMFTFESAALSPGITAPNAARVGGGAPPAFNPNSPRGGNNGNMQSLPTVGQPPLQPFQPPAFQPGIVTPASARAPIPAAPPSNAPRVIAPGPPLPGFTNAADDDDEDE